MEEKESKKERKLEKEKSVLKKEEVKDGPGKRRRVAEILGRFLRWRPSEKDLQERNILKNNIDTSKSALERNQAKKKLTHMFGQYNKAQTGDQKKAYPQIGIEPSKLAEMFPDQPNGIPKVLHACFAYLEKNLQFEGLFRVTGSHIQITNLRMEVENGNFDAIDKCLSPQTVTGMVSLFFRQLPQPLIPYTMFDDYMKVGALVTDQEKIEGLKNLAEQLPPANHRIMVVFMKLLRKIAQNSGANMMSASNLGLVWGPTLLQAIDPMQSMVGNNLTRSCTLVELMIAQYDSVFPNAVDTASSPPPQRPRLPTAPSNILNDTPTSSPRVVRTIGRTMSKPAYPGESSGLSSSSESISPPLSPVTPPASLPPPPPSFFPPPPPPSALPRPTSIPPPPPISTPPVFAPPPPPSFAPPPPLSTPPVVGRPPVARRNVTFNKTGPAPGSSSPPQDSESTPSPYSTPPLSSSSGSISSPSRPPRPPRTNTMNNLSLSPKGQPAHSHGEEQYQGQEEEVDDESLPGAQVIERYDSNPDLSTYINSANQGGRVPPPPPPPTVLRRTIGGGKPPTRNPPPRPPSGKTILT